MTELSTPPTEAEVAELVNGAGDVARRLAFQRDRMLEENAKCRSAVRRFRSAIDASGMDISLCLDCGCPVVCIPDGMPMCKGCADEEVKGGE